MPFKVLRTELKSDLAKLHADITECINPTNFIERDYVGDIAHHTWQIRRYRRVATGIFNNALRQALAQILGEIFLPPSAALAIKSWMSSQCLSHGWLLDPESKRQVASLLEEAGLDESAIEAKAYTLVADDLENANRMVEFEQAGREKALRRIAKYRKNFAVQLRQVSDRALEQDQAPLLARDGDT